MTAPPRTAALHPRSTITALTAFTAFTAFAALAAWPAPAHAELPPLPPAGVDPLGGDAHGSSDARSAEAPRSYDDAQLAFDEELDVIGGSSVRHYRFFVGKYRREIAMLDFLHRVGRDDLVAETTHRRHVAIGLGVAGGLVALAGAGYLASSDGCKQGPGMGFDGVCIATGVGAVVVGAGAFAAALIVSSYPAAPPEDMRRMADEYNTRLRGRVGGASAIVTPYVTRDGAGGVLSLQF
jgi:hypothetical protein